MRIIGDNSASIEKRVTCRNCGVEIGYLPIDIQQDKHTDYTGSTDIYDVIECPNCKYRIQLVYSYHY